MSELGRVLSAPAGEIHPKERADDGTNSGWGQGFQEGVGYANPNQANSKKYENGSKSTGQS